MKEQLRTKPVRSSKNNLILKKFDLSKSNLLYTCLPDVSKSNFILNQSGLSNNIMLHQSDLKTCRIYFY